MSEYGFNDAYIDELYAVFRSNPNAVSEAWRDFFADWTPPRRDPSRDAAAPGAARAEAAPSGGPAVPGAASVPPASPPRAGESANDGDTARLTGISARIAENMSESVSVPTATSVREVPVKLLEENRRVINQHQATTAAPKISFTHLIAWALIRALERHPEMTAIYREVDGKPGRHIPEDVRFGVAVDLTRREERILVVPNVKRSTALAFPRWVAAFDDLISRARDNKLELDDYDGTVVTLTNPGMIGTSLSVPRLMSGQAAIFGVGAIGYPAEYAGTSPRLISELGLSKTMTLTSTYDHRVIQGAASGRFLETVETLLLGREGFYDRIFGELSVPHEPIEWSDDPHPSLADGSGHDEAVVKQASVLQLIRAYRVRGHLYADLDPLQYAPEKHDDLELSEYGLSVWDLDRTFIARGLSGEGELQTLRQILDTLRETYCRHIGVEFMHIQDPEPRRWLLEGMEATCNAEPIALEEQKQILRKLNAAEAFETFLHTNYIGQKRFSLEGAETLIPMLDFLLHDAATAGVEEAVVGMAHRGRLNVLSNVVGKPVAKIFREFEGDLDPETTYGSGDVKYHLGAAGTFESHDGELRLDIRVASNPSHLEAVNPVVEGMARARQDHLGDEDRKRVLPILIHGDAAFAGQGVVAETLNLSGLSGYRTGGTVHIVVNNQIGFTTGPADARSSTYCTDIARMVQAPIFHVNGDHPEDAVRVIRRAFAYRQKFHGDVVVDLFCYRRWGHNEGDDPSYTHPLLYGRIERQRSVRKKYTEQLLRRGDIDPETAESALDDFRTRLRAVHDEVRAMGQSDATPPEPDASIDEAGPGRVDTAVAADALERVLAALTGAPDGFTVHPKLERQLEQRRERYRDDRIDWALAEALAFGTLVDEGVPVRLSGEDSGRGTFSQRHAVLYDYRTAERHVSLDHVSESQARFQVYDSLLSEFAVLGFEYGYSVDTPEGLVMWEAQFGDFVNGAQVIIDQFVSSAHDKWNQRSGLTMLLPHGYEGQGPEHSSCRPERFLQLCAGRNLRVAQPSTPAQYFHLLRRQALDPLRIPLIVMTPKSLLRRKEVVSRAADLQEHRFDEVVADDRVAPSRARRLVLCSGKVYWDLLAARDGADGDTDGGPDVSIARVEQFYPYPREALVELLSRHETVRDIVWVQEEPHNMGAWSFLAPRLNGDLTEGRRLRYVGRRRNASPATGSARRHQQEQSKLVALALAKD